MFGSSLEPGHGHFVPQTMPSNCLQQARIVAPDYIYARRSLKLPITLGVVLIILVVLLTVGWIFLSAFGIGSGQLSYFYWTLLSVGAVLFAMVLSGVILYLALSIKAVNLNRRQSNFMDSVSHELKSPIASLKLYLQTLSKRDVSQQQREQFIGLMLEDVQRLDDLISHLLNAAKLDRPDDGSPEILIDVLPLIERAAATVCHRYQIPLDSITVSGPSGWIRARQVDLDMIFRNLIDNAVKYGGTPPEVQITSHWLHQKKTMLVVQIADNGPGIPIAQRRKVFRRFARLGLELERTKPGTGLGLYIVGTLVNRLKGQVRILNSTDGEGTMFEVGLPAAKENDEETLSK